MSAEIMCPSHPKWGEFSSKLITALKQFGCRDFHTSTILLSQMGGIDLKGSLAYFKEHGGYCDCEVIYNIYLNEGKGRLVGGLPL